MSQRSVQTVSDASREPEAPLSGWCLLRTIRAEYFEEVAEELWESGHRGLWGARIVDAMNHLGGPQNLHPVMECLLLEGLRLATDSGELRLEDAALAHLWRLRGSKVLAKLVLASTRFAITRREGRELVEMELYTRRVEAKLSKQLELAREARQEAEVALARLRTESMKGLYLGVRYPVSTQVMAEDKHQFDLLLLGAEAAVRGLREPL